MSINLANFSQKKCQRVRCNLWVLSSGLIFQTKISWLIVFLHPYYHNIYMG